MLLPAAVGMVILLSTVLILAVARSRGRVRQVSLMTWSELVAELQPVKTEGITALALDLLELGVRSEERGPEEVWDLVGGVDGITRMKENSSIFIAIASHAQRLNPEEGTMATARMRRDDLALRRAVLGLAVGKTLGYGKARVSLYVHEAASAYYLMRKRLLVLYQATEPALCALLDGDLEEARVGQ